jgi:Coenzyme PQQ synthesis protein D (PqqD)
MSMSQMRRQDLVTRIVDGETIILDRVAGRVHQLNRTASYIWNVCEGRSASEIATEMAARFDVIPDMVLTDVQTTLSDFRRLGLVLDARGEETGRAQGRME